MSPERSPDEWKSLPLPAGIRDQLQRLRQTIWQQKLLEGILGALCGAFVSYLLLFLLDRFGETPPLLRGFLFLGGILGFVVGVPLQWYRWVWRIRRLDQIAKLLKQRFPKLGDRLLGIIELSENEYEQSRSRRLCMAAMEQVDRDTRLHDLNAAAPKCMTHIWGWGAAIATILGGAIFMSIPSAGGNALARWLFPWRSIERFTFAQLDELPEQIIVPASEKFEVQAKLKPTSIWHPTEGLARLDRELKLRASLEENAYRFQIPPRREEGSMVLQIGDDRHKIAVLPADRPEIMAIQARIKLPDYLGYQAPLIRDARSGTLSALVGSHIQFEGHVSRALRRAQWMDMPMAISGDHFTSEFQLVEKPASHAFYWEDELGLTPKSPLKISVTPTDDDLPALHARKVTSGQVVLESDVLTFEISAEDDFGIREIGMEWKGIPDPIHNPNPANGEKVLAAGSPEQILLDIGGTFSGTTDNVAPQTLQIQFYVTDYFPDRPRVYSPVFTVHILSADDHAIWMTQQLKQWLRQASQVQQKEVELHEMNRQLRGLSPRELDLPVHRQKIEQQAAAERSNAQQLATVVQTGDNLIREALRNDQFNVATLEDWAQALKVLREMSANRMPSVADLLKRTSQANGGRSAASNPKASALSVGNQRPTAGDAPPKTEAEKTSAPRPSPAPTVADLESGFTKSKGKSGTAGASSPKLGLPTTTLLGGGPAKEKEPLPTAESPAQKQLDAALEEQASILEDFTKVMEELQRIFANLEGSTFVKRLKAASRRQLEIVRDIQLELNEGFGIKAEVLKPRQLNMAETIQAREEHFSEDIFFIQSDLSAYFERIQDDKFKLVLDEMQEAQVPKKLRAMGAAAKENFAGKIALQAEYWADALDRWAEELVGPGCPGGEKCPGGKGNSLPPSVVLEVMKILEREIALRDETRSVEQARPSLGAEAYATRAKPLAETQAELAHRTKAVVVSIRELPQGEAKFVNEIMILQRVTEVMEEAHSMLARPATGPPTIAAETEAIELLLQAKRCNPGGGGSGTSPGGGSGGDSTTPALALVGRAEESGTVRPSRIVAESAGNSGRQLPEEYRAGLDAYFSAIEHAKGNH
jgi:hypothetical protein